MDQHCSKDKITLDIGSWNGVHAMYMASISKHVYTVEPDPTAFRILQANLACNPDLSPQITALPYAISNYAGTVKIMSAGGSGSSILPGMHEKHPQIATVDVECMTFHSFLEKNGIEPADIGFIKMDIEGAETFCIPDMEWFLKDYRGAVCLSLHPGIISDAEITKVVGVMSRYFKQVSGECWVKV
jgi:FkbM family methyltransferase